MNFSFALMQALMAFVAVFAITNVLLERPVDIALLYAGFAAIVMGLTMGYLSRAVTETVPGVTPKQAADAAVALLGGTQIQNPDGSITVQTGFNSFWLALQVLPAPGGVSLRGSTTHIRHVKFKLLGG